MKKKTIDEKQAAADAQPCLPTEVELEEVRRAVNTLVGKWKMDILFLLLSGPRRFGELRRGLTGITQHMLTAQLRSLEADRLVARTVYAEVPPRVEYELTPLAYTLKPVFFALIEWSREGGTELGKAR
jgi:DNA-binding HxlR family transcriptional regulator